MDLSPTTREYTISDAKLWLAGEHGTDSTFTVTLDLATFTGHIVDFTDSRGVAMKKIPSGTPVVKGAGTKYEPCLTRPGAVDTQSATCAGHLFEDVIFMPAATNAGAAVQWHGIANTASIPKPTSYAAAFDTTKGAAHFLYR